MANEFEITKVRLIIRQFLWETRKAVESAEAAQKWLIQFRNTLEYQELEENPDAYALAILAEARSFNNTKQRNQQMRWVRAALEKDGIKNPTDEQLEECWMELYGKNEKSSVDAATRKEQETTADVDTREDSMNIPDGSNAALLESGTSANISGNGCYRQSRRTGGDSVRGGQRCIVPPVRSSGPMPEDRQTVIDYAEAEGLDVEDAIECWYATMERDGKTADGKEISNWKAYIRKWCTTRKKNRRSA